MPLELLPVHSSGYTSLPDCCTRCHIGDMRQRPFQTARPLSDSRCVPTPPFPCGTPFWRRRESLTRPPRLREEHSPWSRLSRSKRRRFEASLADRLSCSCPC